MNNQFLVRIQALSMFAEQLAYSTKPASPTWIAMPLGPIQTLDMLHYCVSLSAKNDHMSEYHNSLLTELQAKFKEIIKDIDLKTEVLSIKPLDYDVIHELQLAIAKVGESELHHQRIERIQNIDACKRRIVAGVPDLGPPETGYAHKHAILNAILNTVEDQAIKGEWTYEQIEQELNARFAYESREALMRDLATQVDSIIDTGYFVENTAGFIWFDPDARGDADGKPLPVREVVSYLIQRAEIESSFLTECCYALNNHAS